MKRNSKISRLKPRVTLRELAQNLNVSIRDSAFHDGVTIADETRQIVLTRGAELGYRPNPLARSQITQRTHIAGSSLRTLPIRSIRRSSLDRRKNVNQST